MVKKKKEEKVDFRCRICGCTTYSEARKGNGVIGPGYQSWVLYYVCGGCSAVFKNPAKFSVAVAPPVAHSTDD